MGRTKRIRGRKLTIKQDLTKAVNLQKFLGLKCPNIQLSVFKETGRGIRCKKKLEQGDTIIALPLHQLITIKSLCHIFNELNFDDQSPQLVLTILLIYEAHLGEKSKYFNYIESLPETYSNLYFCSEAEKKLLPTFLRDIVNKQTLSLEKTYSETIEILGSRACLHCGVFLSTIFSHNKFIWAWFTVNTRSVYYKDEEGIESLALAPFLDLINHSNEADTSVTINLEKELYILKTLKSFKKFDQVFIKYGFHSNLKLLVEYGFVEHENTHDFVEFSFQEVLEGAKKLDINYGDITKLKYHFIKTNKLNQNLTKNKGEFSWNFNGLIYVLVTKDQNLNVLQTKTYSNEFSQVENETIKKIGNMVAVKKYQDFSDHLRKMEAVEKCSESFKMVKNLIKIYLKLLLPT